MKIRPVLKQPSVIPMAVTLGSALLSGCDRKLGGDVPMSPEMQKQSREEEKKQKRAVPEQDYSDQVIPGVRVITPPPDIGYLMVELPQIPDEDVPAETTEYFEDEFFIPPDSTTTP